MYILLNNVAGVQPTEEKVSLVLAAATVATVEGSVKPPVAHHLAIHAQLQTDALASSNIPAENLMVRSMLPACCLVITLKTQDSTYLFHSSRAFLDCFALSQ